MLDLFLKAGGTSPNTLFCQEEKEFRNEFLPLNTQLARVLLSLKPEVAKEKNPLDRIEEHELAVESFETLPKPENPPSASCNVQNPECKPFGIIVQ